MTDFTKFRGQFSGWQHLKTIVASAPGVIDDETDWAGTHVVPTSGLTSTPAKRTRSAEDAESVQVMAVLLDDGVLVARGTCTFSLAPIEVVRRRSLAVPEGTVFPLPADTVIDGQLLEDAVPNSRIDVPIRGTDEFTVRTTDWAAVPAGTTHAVLLWRPG